MNLKQKIIKVFLILTFLNLYGCASKKEIVNNCPVYPFEGKTVGDMFWYVYDRQTIDDRVLNGTN